MSILQTFVMAVMQGITELFPVSSLAHAVILPSVLGWRLDQAAPEFLPFVVALHLGTAIAALIFFARGWIEMALAVVGRGTDEEVRKGRKLLLHIIIATIPAVGAALLFEKTIRLLFATPVVASAFLIINGFLLFAGERFRKRAGEMTLDQLSISDAFLIGLSQTAALIPGISRSGATIVTGLLRGLSHEEATRFSFLIATPVILGAALHELPRLIHGGAIGATWSVFLGGVVAGITAFIAIWSLMRYFRGHEVKALDPFAWYCWIVGLGSLIWLLLG